jgi:predicted Zn-dependent peptidase
MNEGTKKLGSSAFAEALEAKAIGISSSTGTETFVMEVSSLKEEFDEALKYFHMLLQDPNLTQQAIQKVKTTTIGSLTAKMNDFDYIASNALKSILFEKTPLAKPSLGTIESIESIKLKDVEKFIQTNLVSSKLIVVLGGDIDFADIKPKLQNILESLPKGKKTKVKHYDVTKQHKDITLKKETKQAYIYFGSPYNMRDNDKDYYKARVATYILGTGGFGSRLMEEIRVKRGLAYSAYARVHISKSCNY